MTSDEIAIVGAGCRFPGADSLEEFWKVLVNGENHVKEIPLTRWNNSAFYDADKNAKGKSYVLKAGLLNNHDRWDNRLFGIGDTEAAQIDPQQRYVLECVHMALEDAGMTREQLSGSNTGVMIGCMNDDYKTILQRDPDAYTSYSATSMSVSVISARVAYVYNLHGTCLTLDTACSSALVAIHLAGQALRTGDCDAVICGGVSSILDPTSLIPLCKAKMMSAVGQCQTFCDTADGYARGEGCGVVILKRLDDALRDGNKIWATIQTGSNQDGSMTKPITAPSGVQQSKLLKHVYEHNKVDPSTIQYIEAHGTGTPRGDPTEVNALGEFFEGHRKHLTDPLLIGSVKANIGHTESAAGVAGLLKVLLMMKHGKIVPSVHVKPDKSNLNKKIRLGELNLDIAHSAIDWGDDKCTERTACINSFGFGGSNAHAIIKQRHYSQQITPNVTKESHEETTVPICISGIDRDSLKENIIAFQNDLESNQNSLIDMAHTSFCHRDIFSYRTILHGKNKEDIRKCAADKLKKVDGIVPAKERNVIFVFCGVGTTWHGMCQQLMKQNEAFRTAIADIDKYLYPLAGWKIGDTFSTDSSYDDPFLNHIAIFSVQVALCSMWKSIGVHPDAIVGQSVGEVAAACVANLLSLEEAVNVIYHRSKILAEQSEGTMMVVMNMDISEIESHCQRLNNKVTIAVHSSPRACTLSGHVGDIKELKEHIEDVSKKSNSSVLVKELAVKCAYHSKLVEPCTAEIKVRIDDCFRRLPDVGEEPLKRAENVPLISTVTGHVVQADDVRTGAYWADNVRMPVKFMHGISGALDEDKMNVFVEIGPRPVLRAHLPAIMGDRTNAKILPSILANKEISRVNLTMSEMFELGMNLDVKTILPKSEKSNISEIPRYNFKRSTELPLPENAQHYLAGVMTESSDSHMFVKNISRPNVDSFQVLINPVRTPFVYEHFLSGSVLVPGATYAETAFKVGLDVLKKPVSQLSVNVEFVNTFTPSVGKEYALQVDIANESAHCISYAIKTDNRVLATGTVAHADAHSRAAIDVEILKSRLHRRVSKSEMYQSLADINFTYGPSLSLIESAWATETECLAEIHFSEVRMDELTSTIFHPAIIDAVFQMFGILNTGVSFTVPKGVDRITLYGCLQGRMMCYAKTIKSTSTSSHYNALLMTNTGHVVAEFNNFHTKAVTGLNDQISELLPQELRWEKVNEDRLPRDVTNKCFMAVFTSAQGSCVLDKLQSETKVERIPKVTEDAIERCLDQGCTAVVYHVGSDTTSNVTGETLFDMTLQRFMDVKVIFSTLSKHHCPVIPLTVLTENTQSGIGDDFHVDGSELWGMMRAVLHEGLHSNCKLLDIDPRNVHGPTLALLLAGKLANNTEFKMVGSKVYETKLKNTKGTDVNMRQMNIRKRTKMQLMAAKECVIENLFFSHEDNCTSEETKQSEMTLIDTEVTVLHDPVVYLTTEGIPRSSNDVWQEGCPVAEQILTLEGQGKVLNDEKDLHRDVVFCFPVATGTRISVPPACVIGQTDMPSYKSGLIIEMNTLLKMIQAIPPGSEVTCITSSDKPGLCRRFCEYISKGRNVVISFCRYKDISKQQNVGRSVNLILATKLTPTEIDPIFQNWTSLKTVVSIQSLMSEEIQLWAQHKYPRVKITILKQGDMFNPHSLKGTIPKIREFMRKARQEDVAPIVYTLPMKELNIKQMLQNPETRFMSDRHHLFSSRGCYVLIGGLTGLGWELLKLLAEIGAGYIVPMSRREPSASQTGDITSLTRTHNCHILPLQVDISNYDSVQKAFDDIGDNFRGIPVRGIFHGAGVLSDALLVNQEQHMVRNVLNPKVLGTWNLHRISLNFPLDFFVMHSSIVSVIGNMGQSNYAAANSFMDALAIKRRSIGLPAQSLNWGVLAVGMAANDPNIEKALRSRGFRSLSKEQIKKFFIDALMSNESSVVLADIDWSIVASNSVFMSQKSKYGTLLGSVKQANQETINGVEIDNTELMALAPAERQIKLLTTLKAIVNDIFVIDKDAVNSGTSLVSLGVDSMQAMSFANKLNDMFSCQIPLVNLLSEQTTLATITDTLLSDMKATDVQTARAEIREKLDPLHENGTNSKTMTDIKRLFENDDLSYMQIEVLEKNHKKKHDSSQVRITDVSLAMKHHLETWKTALKHVIAIHPELRKLYSFSVQGTIKVTEVPVEHVQPNIVVDDINRMTSTHPYDIADDITFDLKKDLPIKFRIGESNTGTLFRIIQHCLVADMASTTMMCKDIEKTMLCVVDNKPLPGTPRVVHVADAVKRAIQPKMLKLHSFWSDYLNVPMTPVTFGSVPTVPNEEYYEHSSCLVPQNLVQEIQKYIGQRGISLYNFVLSVYQLLLHAESGSEFVPVGTAVDMRYHVPELAKAITRCTNYVPVVARIDRSQTVDVFIKENSKSILETTQNGAYPGLLIPNLLQSQKMAKHIFRHRIVMNDASTVNTIENTDKIKPIQSKLNYETFLRVTYDLRRQWVELEFGFNSDILGFQKGENLPRQLVELMETCLRNSDKTIAHMDVGETTEDCPTNQEAIEARVEVASPGETVPAPPYREVEIVRTFFGKGRKILVEGEFLKQTSQGWDHRVSVRLVENGTSNRLVLEWCKKKEMWNNKARSLNMHEMLEMRLLTINGLAAILMKSPKRWFVLKTANHNQAQRWMTEITSAMQRNTAIVTAL